MPAATEFPKKQGSNKKVTAAAPVPAAKTAATTPATAAKKAAPAPVPVAIESVIPTVVPIQWETITDVRKSKYDQRKIKQAERAYEEAKQAELDRVADLKAKYERACAKHKKLVERCLKNNLTPPPAPEEPDYTPREVVMPVIEQTPDATPSSSTKADKKAAKKQAVAAVEEPVVVVAAPAPVAEAPKKKAEKKATGPSTGTPDELAKVIAGIVAKQPGNAALAVSALGDKLTAATNKSWNKHFKKQYGTMKEFLTSRSEFVIQNDDTVLLRANMPAAKATPKKADKPAKKDKKAKAAAPVEEVEEEEEEEQVMKPKQEQKKVTLTKQQHKEMKKQRKLAEERAYEHVDISAHTNPFPTNVVAVAAVVLGVAVFLLTK